MDRAGWEKVDFGFVADGTCRKGQEFILIRLGGGSWDVQEGQQCWIA